MSTQAATTHELPRTPAAERQGLVQWAGAKFGVEPGKVFPILKQTCFKGEKNSDGSYREASDAEVAALMIVAREHGLNPFLKEIYAFPDKKGGIVPVVGVDGWIRIVNEHPSYDGVDFVFEKFDGAPAWIECHIFRKDRSHPIKVKEFFSECRRDTQPWKSHPARMLRHKAFIQCARLAFGFAGIYDEDEAARIIEATAVHEAAPAQPQRGAAGLKQALMGDGLNVDAQSKPSGTVEQRDALTKKFDDCKDAETLALARDEANLQDWTTADLSVIDDAYRKRLAQLQEAG